jgi:carbon monoxide dehydrogenase subunit G
VKVEGTHELPASRDYVWSMLMNPDVLTRCLPGCEKLEQNGENSYRASIKIGLASIKGEYGGSVAMEDVNPPESYRLVLEGKGKPGFVRGSAIIVLTADGAVTGLRYSGDSVVGGPIASIGQRVLQGLANTLIRQFFESFARELRAQVEATKKAAG